MLHSKRSKISRSLGFCKFSKKFPGHLYKTNIVVEYFLFYIVLRIFFRTEQQEPAKTEKEESKEQEDTENKDNEHEEEGKEEVSL